MRHLIELPPHSANVVTAIATQTCFCVYHAVLRTVLWCRILFHNGFDLLLVSLAISLEEVVRIRLCWRIGIWIIEKILDTK